jgi:hypothetical protein
MIKIFKIGRPSFKPPVSLSWFTALTLTLLIFLFTDYGLKADGFIPPYGYWVTLADLQKIPQATLLSQMGSSSEKDDLKTGASEGSYSKDAEAIFGHGLRRAFSEKLGPVVRVYLIVRGAPAPQEAPLVYYRLTKRSRGRHGGVPLVSYYHRAEVIQVATGLWAADLVAKTYGTLELFSRYELSGAIHYSQLNILHLLREDDKDFPEPEKLSGIPQDWPIFLFPASKYNDMPFRGTKTDTIVSFPITRGGEPLASEKAFLLETKRASYEPESIGFDPETLKHALSPADDPELKVSSGPVTAFADQKNMVALLTLSSGEVMTFAMTVSRSKWSYKKPGIGLALVISVGAIAGIVTTSRRKQFKYNEID